MYLKTRRLWVNVNMRTRKAHGEGLIRAHSNICKIYHTIQNFGERNFWRNSSQQRLVNNILANAQNQGNITKHSLVTHETIRCCDITCCITCNVSWSPAWSTCLVWRQRFVAITNISELVLNFVWPLKFCLLPSSDVKSRSLPTHALMAEEIPKDGI